jgi:hypothetical protein
MKKHIIAIVSLAGITAFGELVVPTGAEIKQPTTITTTVIQAVPIVKIEASEVRWMLPAGTNGLTAPRCMVTKIITDANGKQTTRTKVVPLQKVAEYLTSCGSSLSHVVSILAGAVQMDTNEEFGQ